VLHNRKHFAAAGDGAAPGEVPAARSTAGSSSFLIYASHFGLKGRPFSLVPDPAFLFWSTDHGRAYSMLEYALATFAPICVITGEIGAGKTTLIRHLLATAAPDLRIGLISNAHGERGQLLHWVLDALDEPLGRGLSYVQRFSQLEAILRDEHERGRHTVLIFDEAQNLSARMLEELRCLSNLNDENDELLQIVLVGQPELNEVIARPRMLQFAQRVSAQFHLSGMQPEAVPPYIAHRLYVAGAKHKIFTRGACQLVASASGGLPRVINQICDYALVYAFGADQKTVDVDTVRQVIADRKIQSLTRTRPAGTFSA
jgi:type II secretory pathway predicted ATPase ExeA